MLMGLFRASTLEQVGVSFSDRLDALLMTVFLDDGLWNRTYAGPFERQMQQQEKMDSNIFFTSNDSELFENLNPQTPIGLPNLVDLTKYYEEAGI